ncbi:MAG: FMN-binding glutamate synthase family protein [Pseudomonadales bacterium]
MQLVIPLQRAGFHACLAGLLLSLAATPWTLMALWGVALFGGLSLLGTYHLRSRNRTLSRNYPVLIALRYFLESIGPEFRQYFIESDHDERPFSREQRALVYQRAKNNLDHRPLGTLIDVYGEGYEWINHSLAPVTVASAAQRIVVGATCAKPYDASVFNISALSFGAISPNAVRALNAGAARGGFYHDTGEGSISRYHTEHGGDLVWEIGSGYFGCRHPDGTFDETRFAENAALEQVKMIEIKLSQGAKPGLGGLLPGSKVNAEIAAARGVPQGQDVVSPARHSAFSTPVELLEFVHRLRTLSGGKPVGFKLAIGHPWEWFGIAKAMLETDLLPDFIVVDGAEGGTGAAPLEFINRVGMPVRDGLLLVRDTLIATGLRDRIRIGAAGKITSAFHVFRMLALGADWCNSARGFMFALGCIQAMNCHTGRCPSGVATQERSRWRSLDVTDKASRVYNFHRQTLTSLASLVSAAGLAHVSEVGPQHVVRRISATEVKSLDMLHPTPSSGALLDGCPDQEVFERYWASARPDRFNGGAHAIHGRLHHRN